MATRTSFNKNNSAVKRIMQEARELANDPSTDYTAAPLEDNLFEWHCTIRGPPQTDFEGGLYHFRIILPAEYPFRPPSIMMLTPSGRFETNTQICISFTNYHEELWQPAWGVRTAIVGLQGFFPLKGQAAVGVGSMEAPPSERRRLAKLSREWVCPHCKVSNLEHLPDPASSEASAVPPKGEGKRDEHHDEGTPAGSEAVATPSMERASQDAMMNNPDPASAPSAERTEAPSRSPPVNATSASEPHAATITHRRPQSVSEPQSEPINNQTGMATTVGSASASSALPEAIPTAPSRPPIFLDAAILVLLILVAALLCRKVF